MSAAPLLVTGMPRSGTTWVARQLAASSGTALAGREPMNPRDGQYALAGTLHGWTRVHDFDGRQVTALRRAYAGHNPWVYSRFGTRQWAAPLPWTRVVIKDPFAMLSLRAISRVTQAVPVLVYRHPGAVLTSFRRMRWAPDPAEVAELESLADIVPPHRDSTSDLHLVARMWTVLYRTALSDLDELPGHIVVAHEELAASPDTAVNHLRAACDLSPAGERRVRFPSGKPARPQPARLHNLDRDPQAVASQWRSQLNRDEQEELDELTCSLLDELDRRALR